MAKHTVEEAVNFLRSSYGNITQAAKTWDLNAAEVHAALAECPTNTAEHYVLSLLAQINPMPEPTKQKKQKKITDVVEDVIVIEEDANSPIE